LTDAHIVIETGAGGSTVGHGRRTEIGILDKVTASASGSTFENAAILKDADTGKGAGSVGDGGQESSTVRFDGHGTLLEDFLDGSNLAQNTGSE